MLVQGTKPEKPLSCWLHAFVVRSCWKATGSRPPLGTRRKTRHRTRRQLIFTGLKALAAWGRGRSEWCCGASVWGDGESWSCCPAGVRTGCGLGAGCELSESAAPWLCTCYHKAYVPHLHIELAPQCLWVSSKALWGQVCGSEGRGPGQLQQQLDGLPECEAACSVETWPAVWLCDTAGTARVSSLVSTSAAQQRMLSWDHVLYSAHQRQLLDSAEYFGCPCSCWYVSVLLYGQDWD